MISMCIHVNLAKLILTLFWLAVVVDKNLKSLILITNISLVLILKNYKKVIYYIYLIIIGVYTVDYGNKTNKFAFGGGEGVVYICALSN